MPINDIKIDYDKYIETKMNIAKKDIGHLGEYNIYKELKSFENDGAKFLFNLYVPKENNETTEIDIIMIHKSGLYVIESKNYKGLIYGNVYDDYWKQETYKKGLYTDYKTFFNPIKQNEIHLKWLNDLLENNFPLYNIVIFSNAGMLKNINIDNANVIIDVVKNIKPKINNLITNKDIIDVDEMFEYLYELTQVSNEVKENHIKTINPNGELKLMNYQTFQKKKRKKK